MSTCVDIGVEACKVDSIDVPDFLINTATQTPEWNIKQAPDQNFYKMILDVAKMGRTISM